MNNFKKAFTMIELIFTIVIIGIIAAAGIPQLLATRDDAKVANCIESITLFMRDISSYYTSHGTYALDTKEMTNIKVYETVAITEEGNAGEYYFICDKTDSSLSASDAAITFKFSKVSDGTGNLRTNLNATVASILQGNVDGDLGNLLDIKNIATAGLGIDHPITGLRVKR